MSLSYCTIVNYFKTQENLDTSPQTSDSKLDEFCYSNSKLYEIRVQWIVILRNSSSIKREIFEVFETKLCKLVSKLKLKLEKLIFLELDMCSNSNFSSLMKLEFDQI